MVSWMQHFCAVSSFAEARLEPLWNCVLQCRLTLIQNDLPPTSRRQFIVVSAEHIGEIAAPHFDVFRIFSA